LGAPRSADRIDKSESRHAGKECASVAHSAFELGAPGVLAFNVRPMMNPLRRLLCLVTVVVLASCSTTPSTNNHRPLAANSSRERTLLDADWRFHKGDLGPKGQDDESLWQHVDLPHDYVLGGQFSSTLDRNHGYLPLEVGFYRKHVVIPES